MRSSRRTGRAALALVSSLLATPAGAQYFVATGGDDGGPCTSAAPCLTIQRAVNVITAQPLTPSRTSTVSIGPGVYYKGAYVVGPTSPIFLIGSGSATTVVSDQTANCGTIVASNYAQVFVEAMTVSKNIGCNGGNVLYSQIFSLLTVLGGDVQFGSAASGSHMMAEEFGEIQVIGNYVLYGGGNTHIAVTSNGYITTSNGVATCRYPLGFNVAFVSVDRGFAEVHSPFSGCSHNSGQQYAVSTDGTIRNYTGAPFPGSSNNSASTGGHYYGP